MQAVRRAGRYDVAGVVLTAVAIAVLALAPLASVGSPSNDARAAPASGDAAAQAMPSAVEEGSTLDAFGRLPLAFAPNVGQAAKTVRYAAQGPGFAVAFTRREALLTLVEGQRGATVGLRFLGAATGLRMTGIDALPGKLNNLRGNDPAKWQTGVPTYGTVLYRRVWPGELLPVLAEVTALQRTEAGPKPRFRP